MKHSFKRAARSVFSVPFAVGILVGAGALSASASIHGSSVFSDVVSGSYYDTAVGELNAAGIIKGNGNKFRPGDAVSRAEVAVMMARLRAEMKGEVWDDGASSTGSNETSSSSRRRSSSSSSVSSSSSSSSSSVSSSSSYNPKGAFRFTTTTFTVDKALSKVTISVVRTGGNEGTAAINYATTNGTAIAGTDYQSASGTLTLSNKETSKTFTISLLGGTGDKSFTITLSNPQYGVGLASPSTATVTIKGVNGGSASSGSSNSSVSSSSSTGPAAGTFNFAATAYAIKEGGTALTVTVLRNGGSSGTANVNYATVNGSATSGTDYTGINGTLTFAAGETSKTFSIASLNNSSITGNRSFTVTLSTPTGGSVLGEAKSSPVTIFDDESGDFGSGALKFAKASYEVTQSQGNLLVTVMRTGGANGQITVDYSTTNGSAYAGVDYTSAQGTLTFAPGEASKTFIVPILKSSTLGSERTINLILSNQTNTATLVSPYNATVTIFH
jgi:hypothetical protein